MAKLFLEAQVKSLKEGQFEIVASSGKVDRLGDTIDPKGWYLTNYKKNPVILWAHLQFEPPVARALKTWVEQGKELRQVGEFAPTSFAQELRTLVEGGFLNAVSVGFMPLVEDEKGNIEIEGKMYRKMLDKELKAYLEKGYYQREGQKFTKQELLEVSWVNVPALATALVEARKMNLQLVTKSLEDIELESKGVVSYSDYPVAPEDTTWDGAQAEQALRKWASSDGSGDKDTIDWSKFSKGFCWFDSSDKENFGSYKLPHHDIIGGEIKTVWKGVVAAMVVLLGGRGGVDIPEADKKGIYNHLVKHYKQFDKEPPEYKTIESPECSSCEIAKNSKFTLEGIKDAEEVTEIKPYPNEHSCRLENPDKYKRFRRQNCKVKHEGKCIDFIFGVRDEGGEEKVELQAMRYPKDVWDADDARAHCKNAGGSFEPASEKKLTLDELEEKANSLESTLTELRLAISSLKETKVPGGTTPTEAKGRKSSVKQKSDLMRLLIMFDKMIEILIKKLRQQSES